MSSLQEMLMNPVFIVAAIIFAIVVIMFFMRRENFSVYSHVTDTHPGCADTKVADLLVLFDGDVEKLKDTMYSIGVPLNYELNDENAPMIATYLINHGEKITKSCRLK
jgi:cell shape-determining protein MreC